MNWWHIAHTPTGVHARQINPVSLMTEAQKLVDEDPELVLDEAVAEVLGDRAEAHRQELGFPIKGRWVMRTDWDSQLSQGEPHSKLLATATVTQEE